MDITDGLSAEEIEELRELADEPEMDNSVSEEEFKKLTERWRTKQTDK